MLLVESSGQTTNAGVLASVASLQAAFEALSEAEQSLFKKEALLGIVIRTLPNSSTKPSSPYSGTNPPYLLPASVEWLRQSGAKHLVVDLPSVDREVGALLRHPSL